jgi:hypothetical protein
MAPILTPRAARYDLSHGVAAPAQAGEPIDWRQANMDMNSRRAPKFVDHAFPVLYGEPTIDDRQREELWDIYHTSRNATELAQRLHPMPLHPDLKEQLLRAKNKPSVELDPIDKVFEAIQWLDPQVLEIAESHPFVLKHMVDLATQGER